MVTVEFDTSSLTGKLSNASTELISKTLEYTAEDLIRNLMINSPVDHGLLKQWAITEQSDLEIVVQSPAEYAVYQNYGTAPYDIYPKNRQYLWWPGAEHPVKHVSHPGIQGKHFVEDSIEAVTPRLEEFFHKAKEEVLP